MIGLAGGSHIQTIFTVVVGVAVKKMIMKNEIPADRGKAMRAYITKYALTKGIRYVKGECDKFYPEMFVPVVGEGSYRESYFAADWANDWPTALAQVERKRAAKLRSLRKQIAKIEALKFEEPKP